MLLTAAEIAVEVGAELSERSESFPTPLWSPRFRAAGFRRRPAVPRGLDAPFSYGIVTELLSDGVGADARIRAPHGVLRLWVAR